MLQSSHYTIGTLLVTLASLVSFPIFTRMFSVADYGAMNLIGSLLLFWTSLGKLGMQQSVARFLGEVQAGKRAVDEAGLRATILIGMGLTGLAATALAAITSLVVPAAWWHDDRTAGLLLPVSALVAVRVLDSGVVNLMRAQQRSLLLNAYLVLRKYATLAVILLLIMRFMPGLEGFYLATFVVEALAVGIMVYVLSRGGTAPARFSRETFRDMLVFGMPLIAFEISGIVLNLGDRYVIQVMMGAEPLGHYSAAYNLCEYVKLVLLASLAQAVVPIYVRLWEEKGEEACRQFVERALRVYLMLALPIVAGLAAVGDSLLVVLASEKYAAGAPVIPWVIAGMCVDGGAAIFGAGMYIHKQNRRIVPWVVGAAVLNVALNVALIPSMGILAAALSTLLCYALIAAAAWVIGARHMPIRFPFVALAKYGALSAIMFAVVREIHAGGRIAEMLLRIAAGVAIYGVLLLACDRQAREAIGVLRARFFPTPQAAR